MTPEIHCSANDQRETAAIGLGRTGARSPGPARIMRASSTPDWPRAIKTEPMLPLYQQRLGSRSIGAKRRKLVSGSAPTLSLGDGRLCASGGFLLTNRGRSIPEPLPVILQEACGFSGSR